MRKKPRRYWQLGAIGLLGYLLWSTKRHRTKIRFNIRGDGSLTEILPSLTGISEGPIDHGNRIEVIQNGKFFERLLEDVARAEKSIHIESYIWWDGEICRQVAEALASRAREGVEVRVIVDYTGSIPMKDSDRELMRAAGCAVRRFRAPRVRNMAKMNLRTHRKIAVVDGRVGYVGGHGFAQQWTGDGQDKDHWRDTAIRMEGPVVTALQGVFCENWIEETGEVPTGDSYFPRLAKAGDIDAHVAFASPRGSVSAVQLLYYLAINGAHRELLIQNPYFLPNLDAIAAMHKAVKRGVDVRVMVPSENIIDSAIVVHASHHLFTRLLKGGVRVFRHRTTMTHQKIMIVDGLWSSVGSTNFDDRSFQLNDEVTVGVIDRGIAGELREAFLRDMANCSEVKLEQWHKRHAVHRALDGVCYAARAEL